MPSGEIAKSLSPNPVLIPNTSACAGGFVRAIVFWALMAIDHKDSTIVDRSFGSRSIAVVFMEINVSAFIDKNPSKVWKTAIE